MKPRALIVASTVVLGAPQLAAAGGLFLPGAGAVSTSRAGAAVASADDGEALAINPAGLAKAKGNTITVSAAMISYAMQFTRRGTYDDIANESFAYEGMAYPTVRNDVKPPLGLGSMQPVPVAAFVTDLGGLVPNLHLAIGLYAPNAYPFRDMCTELPSGCSHYVFNGNFDEPPPPSRYDIMKQDAAVILPSIAASYRILPELDVGARFSAGFATLKSTTAIWGMPANVTEFVKRDSVFSIDAKDSFVPAFGLGVTYRPTPSLELAANYNSQVDIHAKGTAVAENGPNVELGGSPIVIGPKADAAALCATGGTLAAQKACVELALPMNAQLGGRYKFLGADGTVKGDIELDLDWENWGASAASNYRVVVDAAVYMNGMPSLDLHDNVVRHGLQDTFGVRLGGSYNIPMEGNTVIVRGGVAYDTAAAKEGWLRSDFDGAARTTLALGGAFHTKRFEINVGGGYIFEGSPNNPGNCNIVSSQLDMRGCNGDGNETPLADRQGPDPINPLNVPEQQLQNPVTQGTYKAHYVLLMLGFTTWF
jgi:long-subunit fatty acid transport protein